jgi:hypothetical protein
MIVNQKILIKITHKSYKFYNLKGYEMNVGDEIEVLVSDLPIGSHLKIDIKCDLCGLERSYIYQGYMRYTKNNTIPYYCNRCNSVRVKESFEKRFGEGITNSMHVNEYREKQKENLNKSLSDHVSEKRKSTNNIKYGTDTPCQNLTIKSKLISSINSKSDYEKSKSNKKREITCLRKYGVHNVNLDDSILEKSKNTRIETGRQIPDEELTDFRKYRKKVSSFTNKNKKTLLKIWDGFDFYDGDYIRENFSLHKYDKSYPTIDHKYSVLNGFLNGVDPEVIANIENLCLTKRSNNSKKSSNNFLYLLDNI